MTATGSADREGVTILNEYRYADFEISWAGDSPFGGGLCLGSEDGRLLFANLDGSGTLISQPVVASGDAINGVAFLPDMIAVSTRSDVVFLSPPGQGLDRKAVFEGGAHGVIATPAGKFVAPLGKDGLLFMDPGSLGSEPFTTLDVDGPDFYFYGVADTGSGSNTDLLTCALRRGGWGTVGSNGSLTVVPLIESDVVDVCSIASDRFPHAAALVEHDRSINLIRDVTTPFREMTSARHGATFRIEGPRGVAYKVMAARGHLILLTSEGLYLLTDLVDRFLKGQSSQGYQTSRCVDFQAVDAFVVRERYIFLVRPDGGVSTIEVADAEETTEKPSVPSSGSLETPVWPPLQWGPCQIYPQTATGLG